MKIITRKERIKRRVRAHMIGTKECPRISVHRTNKHIYVQAIDDTSRVTLAAVGSVSITDKKGVKTDMAKEIGTKMAELLKKKQIAKGVFDRGSNGYLGRVKALAEAMRNAGISI